MGSGGTAGNVLDIDVADGDPIRARVTKQAVGLHKANGLELR